MKTIIVDDEPRAIELLKSYLEHFNSLELVATFRNGLKALEFIAQEPVDLLFLDINMPHISGIALSKMLPENARVIFTTAYSEYAVESYEVAAVDYLLKPISLERFTQAVRKVLGTEAEKQQAANTWIAVKSGAETFRIAADKILYLQKDGNYITYYCENEKILGRETIQEALDKLPDSFIQTHKSYIVNIEKVRRYSRNTLTLGSATIPISALFQDAVFGRLER